MSTAARLLLSMALLCLGWLPRAGADERAKDDEGRRAEILVLEALRSQLATPIDIAYSEFRQMGSISRRFDWAIASFPEGDWSCLAHLPTHDGAVEGHLRIRVGSDILIGVVTPNGSWHGSVEDYAPERIERLAPTASRWFPVDSLRVDQWIAQWDPLAAKVEPDRVSLVYPANTAVLDALRDPNATIAGLFGHRFEFQRSNETFVLSRADILLVFDGDGGEQAACLDSWRDEIMGHRVCRSHSTMWSDYRQVGPSLVPMQWEYRHPKGVTKGGMVPGSIRRLSSEGARASVALRIPEDWTGPGRLRDGRSGEVLFTRRASLGLAEGVSPPAPPEYASLPGSPEDSGPRASVVLLCVGVLLAVLGGLVWMRFLRLKRR